VTTHGQLIGRSLRSKKSGRGWTTSRISLHLDPRFFRSIGRMFIFLLKGLLISSNGFTRRISQSDLDCNRAEGIEYLKHAFGEGSDLGGGKVFELPKSASTPRKTKQQALRRAEAVA
jgi:hypothetical protein